MFSNVWMIGVYTQERHQNFANKHIFISTRIYMTMLKCWYII